MRIELTRVKPLKLHVPDVPGVRQESLGKHPWSPEGVGELGEVFRREIDCVKFPRKNHR